jgi:hypothetical protein
MFMAFHSTAQRKPMLTALAMSLLILGIGVAVSLR